MSNEIVKLSPASSFEALLAGADQWPDEFEFGIQDMAWVAADDLNALERSIQRLVDEIMARGYECSVFKDEASRRAVLFAKRERHK